MWIRVLVMLLACGTASGWSQSHTSLSKEQSSTSSESSTDQLPSNQLSRFTSYSEQSALTVPRGLDQLSREAETIVRGSIVSVRVEPHPELKNLRTVVVTMNVDRTLKGTQRKTHQFRQYIWDKRDQIGAAGYFKGQEMLLLLGPVSPYGLTSPVGLEQGRFRIVRDARGNISAVNGKGNAGLFQSVAERAQARGIQLSPVTKALVRRTQGGAVPLQDLEDAIATFARAK